MTVAPATCLRPGLRDLSVVDKTVDQRDGEGGVEEHLAPLGEGSVGVTSVLLFDELREISSNNRIAIAVEVEDIANLVDHQQRWACLAVQAAAQG